MAVSPISSRSGESTQSLRSLALAAIDLDGTLLGPDLRISPENLQALGQLQARGLEVVVATGRHYASLRPFLDELPAVNWLVSFQGAEVSDRARRQLLARHMMEARDVQAVLKQARERGVSYFVYSTDSILTDLPPNEDSRVYTRLSGVAPLHVSPAELDAAPVFKILWMAERAVIDSVVDDGRVGEGLEKVRTYQTVIEFIPQGVTKASGLAALARHLGIDAKQVVAFGDAENDIPMFRWAGRSVAMAHGWPAALAAASQVGPPGPPETALARSIAAVFSGEGGAT